MEETGIGLGSDRPPDGHSLRSASIPSMSKTNKKEEHIVFLIHEGRRELTLACGLGHSAF